jgi:cation transport protein ChaC
MTGCDVSLVDPVSSPLSAAPIFSDDVDYGGQYGPRLSPRHADEELWVFGYGSLMWRPGFEYLERVPARLIGLHRTLCVYSFEHRGTPERPGLVLGLDRGGACRGIAYRVAAARRQTTIAYLREREQSTKVYIEALRRITLASPAARVATALVYIVDRSHPQYAGRLDMERQLHLVRQGHGRSGPNLDYVLSTVAEIEAQGCRDSDLHGLAQRLKGHEAHGQAERRV